MASRGHIGRWLVSECELEEFAKALTAVVAWGATIGLCGELGAGKTAFVRALVAQLIPEARVSSPSFVLSLEYSAVDKSIEHWDLYRLGASPIELLEAPSPSTLRLIEWVDKFPELLRQCELVLIFRFVEHQSELREVTVEAINAFQWRKDR